ncbi:acetyltransferase [Pseudoalteromonas xiamenensis]
MKDLIIIGSGDMAKTLTPYLSKNYRIIGFAINDSYINKNSDNQPSIFSIESLLKNKNNEKTNFIISIGYFEMNSVREKLFISLCKNGYEPVTLIADDKLLDHNLEIGAGTIILDNTSIHSGTKIGKNTFISTGVNIGHGCEIGDNVWINSGVTIAGNVKIGNNTVFGVGATIGDNIEIGASNFIGAGSLIVSSTNDFETFAIKQTEKLPINSSDFLKLVSVLR